MPHTIPLSIRYLAEFVLKNGSIDNRFGGLNRGVSGTRAHRRLQKQGGKNYEAEVPLSIKIEHPPFVYALSGRADGVITQNGHTTIDEIKTTTRPLAFLNEEDNPAHWAQGICYAHILCSTSGLAGCSVQLTYYNIDTEEIKRFVRTYTAAQLAAFVQGLLKQYHRWAQFSVNWHKKRDDSLRALAFPFPAYREGQRGMAVACYNAFKEGDRLFCCAPTGIGKTMSALFPAMKAVGEGVGRRIFYLTAKTIARHAAQNAVAQLQSRGSLHFHSLTLTAKDKICFLEQRNCQPGACPYANGYYSRVNDVLYETLQLPGPYTREAIEQAARKHMLCPYEFSLDLAQWCDCIIGDYNYMFDPVVHLQRFFEAKADNLFLVDEAHNLVERSRAMYTARLHKAGFWSLKKALPKQHKQLHRALAEVNGAFVALRKECEAENASVLRHSEVPRALAKPLARFTSAAEAFLEEQRGSPHEDALLQLYFDVLFYGDTAERYAKNYTTLLYRHNSDVAVELLCLDPAQYLDESMGMCRAGVLFSATLQPLRYYRSTLGGGSSAKLLNLQSPFPQSNLGLFVADGISTKYASRPQSLVPVANLLATMAAAKEGNYIAYFPSYSYMRQVLQVFTALHPTIATLVQTQGMDEAARETFVAAFKEESTCSLLAFCVLGGIFSEGIDLPGNRLIGTAIAGVGLPQIGPQPNSFRAYYDEENGCGFEYAYQFPGMNKVLQAAGRVIRTETDRGVVLLIDSRFTTQQYQALFPAHWAHWQQTGQYSLPGQLRQFWQSGL